MDNNYLIISFTAYEKGPYCPIRKILSEFIKNNEIRVSLTNLRQIGLI